MIIFRDRGISYHTTGRIIRDGQTAGFGRGAGWEGPPGNRVAEDEFRVVAVRGAGGYVCFGAGEGGRDSDVFVEGSGDAED